MSPVDIPYADATAPRIVTGIALNAPTGPGDTLYVRVPMYHNAHKAQAYWTPHGNSYPQMGTECLVALDQNNILWVVSWIGPWS